MPNVFQFLRRLKNQADEEAQQYGHGQAERCGEKGHPSAQLFPQDAEGGQAGYESCRKVMVFESGGNGLVDFQ